MKCCNLIYWKHEDGWDVYRREDCYQVAQTWVPTWFDTAVVEDLPTKAEAIKEMKDWHKNGFCLVSL